MIKQIQFNRSVVTIGYLQTLQYKMFLSGCSFLDVLQINFDNYKAIVSFVNIHNSHWKLLVSNDYIYIYLDCLSFSSGCRE